MFLLLAINLGFGPFLERRPELIPILGGLSFLLLLVGAALTYRENRRGDPKFRLELGARDLVLSDPQSNEIFRAQRSQLELGEECLRSSSRYGTSYRRVLRLGRPEHCLRLVDYDALLGGSDGRPLVQPDYVIPGVSLAQLEALLRVSSR